MELPNDTQRCTNEGCPLHPTCARFTAPYGERVVVGFFEPDWQGKCTFYINDTPTQPKS